jgi:hypothetical protein
MKPLDAHLAQLLADAERDLEQRVRSHGQALEWFQGRVYALKQVQSLLGLDVTPSQEQPL